MTRVLFLGDLAFTGFGTVTMDLGREMLARGEDVRFVSLNEVGDLPEPFASRTLRAHGSWLTVPTNPEEAKAYLEREARIFTAEAWDDGWAPEAAIILADFEGMRQWVNRVPVPRNIPIFHYCPIEGVDLPPRWAIQWQVLRPVACSEFGADQIERVMGKRPPMIYHGVDTKAFRPVTPFSPLRIGDRLLKSKADCRTYFCRDPRIAKDAAKRTWLLRTDRHMPRKRYNDLFASLVPVFEEFRDVDLVIHCAVADQGGNLLDAMSKLPKWFSGRVLMTQAAGRANASREAMVALYNASDLYVTNGSEGFGLTIAESLACGVPAVGLDFSSVPEVIGPGGVLVSKVGLFENPYDHLWGVAEPEAFAAAVRGLLLARKSLPKLGALGMEHVRKSFSWSRAAEQFSELIGSAVRQEIAA
jgi:glycosyltransferase involved in cell wall biosynthesis